MPTSVSPDVVGARIHASFSEPGKIGRDYLQTNLLEHRDTGAAAPDSAIFETRVMG